MCVVNRMFIEIFSVFFFLCSFNASDVEASETAIVKADSLIVYSGMTTESDVVKTLKKGETVTVELEVSGPHGAWCGITEKGQKEISGFVLCEYLERAEVQIRSSCFWTIDATFWGDAKGSATVLIHCRDGTGIVSVSSDRGTYYNIPIDASGDEKSVTLSGSGSYGHLSYSGVAKGTKSNNIYSGAWKVKLVGETDGRVRNFSGKWRGTGNYRDMCRIDSCK